jgi:hypothetical protein
MDAEDLLDLLQSPATLRAVVVEAEEALAVKAEQQYADDSDDETGDKKCVIM